MQAVSFLKECLTLNSPPVTRGEAKTFLLHLNEDLGIYNIILKYEIYIYIKCNNLVPYKKFLEYLQEVGLKNFLKAWGNFVKVINLIHFHFF